MISSRALLALLALTSSCYFYYPKQLPKVDTALIVEGEKITLSTRPKTWWSTCPDSDLAEGRCEQHDGKWRKAQHVLVGQMNYNGRALTRSEFYQLTIADYGARVQSVKDEKSTCRISLVPSALAVASAIVAIGVPLFFSTSFNDDQQRAIYIGGAVGTVVFAALSYPIGGFACVRARSKVGDLLENATLTEWEASDLAGFDELVKDADDFNNGRIGSSTPVVADKPAGETPPTSDPPPDTGLDVVSGTSMLDVAVASGKFTQFLRALEVAGGTEWLKDKGPYTLFAPTDEAFAKLSQPYLDALFKTKGVTKKKLQQLWLYHFAPSTFSSEQVTDKLFRLKSQAGTDLRLKRKDGELTVEGAIVTEPGLTAPNGVIYGVDKLLE